MSSTLRFDRAPSRVYWEVTRACDLACRHCRAESAPAPGPAELSTQEGLALIDRLARFGPSLPHLILTGGDPLKRPDLFALIAAARTRGFAVSLAPSATPLLTPAMIDRLAAARVEALSLSLDGSDAARHDALRQVPGCFDRTLTAARACVATDLPFQVNTLVCEETLSDLPAIRALAAALGAARWSLFFLVGVGRGTVLQPIGAASCVVLFEALLDSADPPRPVIGTTEAPHWRRVVYEHARRSGRGAAGPAPRPGHAAGIRDGNGIMFVSDTGDVRPSGFFALSAGNVRRADPVDLYRGSGLFRALRRPDLFGGRCGRCEWREACGGSRARALAATGDPLAEDPLCRHEPVARAG
jgi:AdoMet-dependent heme synthase